MSITTPVTLPANTRASDVPRGYAAIQTAPNVFTVYNDDDLFSASIPALLGANLLEGPITLDARFVGMHAKAADAAYYRGGWNRSHDQAPKWAAEETASGVYVNAGMDAWLDSCAEADQEAMWTVIQTPTFHSRQPTIADSYGKLGGSALPVSLSTLGNYITWRLTRNLARGRRTHYLELWNEPQINGFLLDTPADLAAAFRVAKIAAKAVDPQIKIVGPACTACNTTAANYGIDWTDQFLKASDGAGGTGKDHIDILSIHTYIDGGTNDLTQVLNIKTNVQTLKANNGISAMPVWSTEFGYVIPDFALYKGPEPARANALLRFFLWNVVAGMSRASLYPMGWAANEERARLFREIASLLNGATIQRINRIAGTPSLAVVINGQRRIV